MERPLYAPARKVAVVSDAVAEGEADLDASLLFEQVFVDRARLAGTVRRSLQACDQISLSDLLTVAPVEQGLAEVVTYLALDDESFEVVFDDGVQVQISWDDASGVARRATLPGVTFVRMGHRSVPAPSREVR
jgi:hypothetical protein